MKARAAVILIQNGKIALIERYRQGLHYFVFPGGKVEAKETPAQAAARETKEELGLKVVVGAMVAVVWYLGSPQYYFLAQAAGGQFGQGNGSEMNSAPDSTKGTYHPIWMELTKLKSQPLLPKIMTGFVLKSIQDGWAETPLLVKDQPPDEASRV